ncbi:MAG: choice-of-anchor B family protein [Candidatus Methylacidiphilales bacterium]
MHKLYILVLSLFSVFTLKAQQSMNMDLLAQWNNTSLPKIDGDQLWSDIGGYYDSTNKKEYAILLGNDSFYFFDITVPTSIKLVSVKDGYSTKSINRDVEVYGHYAYFVSERSGSLGGLQILDLQYLPDSVHEVYRSNDLSVQAHTVFVEAASKRLYICQNSKKTSFSAMDVYSIQNPEQPTFLASLQVPINGLGSPQFNQVHEMFSRNDTVYLSCYEAGLYIMDLRNLSNQKLLSVISNYPQRGTNHSSWLNEKGDKIMFTDENLGSPIKIFDIKDISNPKQVVYFNSHPNALPHNAYWKNNMAVVSSYEDGVYVYDLTDPNNPKKHAYYDTYTLNADGVFTGFHGCWGVCPYLPSGNIIASDISEGLFVLKVKYGVGTKDILKTETQISVFPNPAKQQVTLQLNNLKTATEAIIYNLQGQAIINQIVAEGNNLINTSNLKSGMYILKVNGVDFEKTVKVIID